MAEHAHTTTPASIARRRARLPGEPPPRDPFVWIHVPLPRQPLEPCEPIRRRLEIHIARCLAILDVWDGDADAEDDIDAEAETDCDLSDDEPMFPHRDLLRLQLARAGCQAGDIEPVRRVGSAGE